MASKNGRNMKIAFVTSEFVSEGLKGGQATYINNVARIFASKGHRVFVITMSESNERFLWNDGITVVRVKCEFESWILKKLFGRYSISFFLNHEVNRLNRAEHFDVVQFSNLRGIPLLINKKLPSVVRISNYAPACKAALEENYNMDEVKPDKIQQKELLSLRRAKVVFGPSKVCADLTSNYISKDIKIIESPVCYSRDKEEPYFWKKVIGNKKYILFFGTLNFIKGLHMMCSIADDILDKYPEEYLIFLGAKANVKCDGKLIDSHSYIDRNIIRNRNRVIVLDPIYEKKQTNYILDKADICVMPSRIDNLPNTCIEAMTMGKIVVGTRGASYEQVIDDNVSGFLAEIDDRESLLYSVDRALSLSGEEKTNMGLRAMERTKKMRPDVIYLKLLELYEGI